MGFLLLKSEMNYASWLIRSNLRNCRSRAKFPPKMKASTARSASAKKKAAVPAIRPVTNRKVLGVIELFFMFSLTRWGLTVGVPTPHYRLSLNRYRHFQFWFRSAVRKAYIKEELMILSAQALGVGQKKANLAVRLTISILSRLRRVDRIDLLSVLG